MDTTENYGTLTVKTESAFGALPVKDATVSFRRQTGDGAKLFAVLMTDEDGETEPLKIPAPPVSNSLSPGGETPYSLVNVEVEDGIVIMYMSNELKKNTLKEYLNT